MQVDKDLLEEGDFKRLHAALTFIKIAIQRHKASDDPNRDNQLYGCLPEMGGAIPDMKFEKLVGSSSFYRIEIMKCRMAIRRHMTDKNNDALYVVLGLQSPRISFPKTAIS